MATTKTNSLRDRLRLRVTANQATDSKTPIKRNKNSTEHMVSALSGDFTRKAQVRLRVKSKPAVVNKLTDKEPTPVKATLAVKPKVEADLNPPKLAPASLPKAKAMPVIAPVIFLQDSLLRTQRYVDLNKAKLLQVSDENSIEFDAAICQILFDKRINFFIEASANPMPDILVEAHTGSCVKRYFPKDREAVLEVKFVTSRKKSRYDRLTYSQIMEVLEQGDCTLSQVCGNLTNQQIKMLNVKLVSGEHFSFYEIN